MPGKNSIKEYVPDAYYHLYNRGVDKQPIFREDQDFWVLLSYLKTYLEPKNELTLRNILARTSSSYKDKQNAIKLLNLNNFYENITLLGAHCLCLIIFILSVQQKEADAIDKFMNSSWTRYTMYFNKKYKRVGTIFQDVYKAGAVKTDEQLLYLSKYIHRNPIAKRHFRNPASKGDALRGYFYSSYPEYLGLIQTSWVHPEIVLGYFNSNKKGFSYADFVESEDDPETLFRILSPVIIEEIDNKFITK